MGIFDQYPWILAIAIFFARICDVSLGTVRTIMVFRGYQMLAAIIGFFEVLIWVLAAERVLKGLDQWYLVIAYCGGFATGNMVGIWLEAKVAMGTALITAISENTQINLTRVLREKGYAVTALAGKGHNSVPIEIAIMAEKRRDTPELLSLIEKTDPDTFYTVEDVRKIYNVLLRAKDGKRPGWLGLWTKKK